MIKHKHVGLWDISAFDWIRTVSSSSIVAAKKMFYCDRAKNEKTQSFAVWGQVRTTCCHHVNVGLYCFLKVGDVYLINWHISYTVNELQKSVMFVTRPNENGIKRVSKR